MSERPLHFLIGHGSRSPDHRKAFEALVQQYQSHYPQYEVHYGFLDYLEPHAETTLQKLAEKNKNILVLPIFLSKASHTQQDIPQLLNKVKSSHQNICFSIAEPLGEHECLKDILDKELSLLIKTKRWNANETDLLILGRGSSIKSSLNFITSLSEKMKPTFQHSHACFWDIAEPSLKQALLSSHKKNLILQPMFLFPGLLLNKLELYLNDFFKETEPKPFVIHKTLSDMHGLIELIHQQSLHSKLF